MKSNQTKTILAAVLWVIGGTLLAQKTETKVHIRKVENVNGVKKVFDTTYTTNSVMNKGDLPGIPPLPGLPPPPPPPPGKVAKSRTIAYRYETDSSSDNGKKGCETIYLEYPSAMSAKFISREPFNGDSSMSVSINFSDDDFGGATLNEQVFEFVNEEISGNERKNTAKSIYVSMRFMVADPNPEELKRAGVKTTPDSQLAVEDLKLRPTDQNKLEIEFRSSVKGEAEITLMDINGKILNSAKVQSQDGVYTKELSVEGQAKGVYLLRITQDGKTIAKKIAVN